jgi:LmbE family N-acetylglucosaminyl deacetylase
MNFSKNTKILVLAAHPDDEVLGCGGTLAIALKKKARVKIIFFGEGVTARYQPGKENSDDALKAINVREDEARKALKILKIKDYKFGDKHSTKFDKYSLATFTKEIEHVIEKFEPDIIFTHSSRDLNIDHVIIHKASMIACRPGARYCVKQIYSFEVPCSSNWIFEDKFNPNFYVDISNTIHIKQSSFSQYKNENRPFPFPRSKVGIDTLAKYRGMQSGLKFAEAFKLERAVQKIS